MISERLGRGAPFAAPLAWGSPWTWIRKTAAAHGRASARRRAARDVQRLAELGQAHLLEDIGFAPVPGAGGPGVRRLAREGFTVEIGSDGSVRVADAG